MSSMEERIRAVRESFINREEARKKMKENAEKAEEDKKKKEALEKGPKGSPWFGGFN